MEIKGEELVEDDYTLYQDPVLIEYNGAIERKRVNHGWLIALSVIAFAVVFFFVSVFTSAESVYIKTYVRGPSMMPTLNLNFNSAMPNANMDVVYLNTYDKGSRGDIIVDNYLVSTEVQYVIKRIIAVEGDTLRIVVPNNNAEPTQVFINGKLLNEPYIKDIHYEGFAFLNDNQVINEQNFPELNPIGNSKDGTITIPKGYVFYMGDNRNNSSDCRGTGPRKADKIVGKVDYIVRNGDKDLKQSDLFWPGVKTVLNHIGQSIKDFFNIK